MSFLCVPVWVSCDLRVCVYVFVCGLIRAEKVAGWNIFSLRWPATAACHRNSNPHRKAWPLSLPPQFTLPTQAGESLQSITAKQYTHTHTHTHTHTGHYKMAIYISYVPVWICLGHTVTNGGDVVKVFMLCNPTVYLLVIWGSEGKHILCLISHLLSG